MPQRIRYSIEVVLDDEQSADGWSDSVFTLFDGEEGVLETSPVGIDYLGD